MRCSLIPSDRSMLLRKLVVECTASRGFRLFQPRSSASGLRSMEGVIGKNDFSCHEYHDSCERETNGHDYAFNVWTWHKWLLLVISGIVFSEPAVGHTTSTFK